MESEHREVSPSQTAFSSATALGKCTTPGERFRRRTFTAFVLNQSQKPRIGITATRKFGNSVERNRARRLVRDAFRKNKWLVPNGVDIVINVKHRLAEASYNEFEGDFVTFLKKAGNQ